MNAIDRIARIAPDLFAGETYKVNLGRMRWTDGVEAGAVTKPTKAGGAWMCTDESGVIHMRIYYKRAKGDMAPAFLAYEPEASEAKVDPKEWDF